jgi:hypothetical protein
MEEFGNKMKSILTSICLGLALVVTASAQDRYQDNSGNTTKVRRGNARTQTATAPATTTRHVTQSTTTQRNISNAPVRQRTYTTTPRYSGGNANVRSTVSANARFQERNFRTSDQARVRSNVTLNRERNFRDRTFSANAGSNVTVNRDRNFGVNRERNLATNRDRNLRFNQGSNVTVNRDRKFGVNRERNLAVNRDRNVEFNQRANVRANRNRNVVVTNNWHGSQFQGRQYAAFRDYHRTWHDRDWWRHHYTRIIFVSGGWWYWNVGYWYPAWGYDSYAYYPYDGPIYGNANLSPDRVVSEVQAQLERDGYYAGPIDGVLGPMTRQAIADFQADNGLAITSTVDEPTLDTLGIS